MIWTKLGLDEIRAAHPLRTVGRIVILDQVKLRLVLNRFACVFFAVMCA